MIAYTTCETAANLHSIYAQNMRASMFTGFLTLSSFLLATQTLLIIQLRKDVYERQEYLQAHRLQRPGIPVYKSLQSLSHILTLNILLALSTSIIQFSVGFIDSLFTTIICLAFPLVTVLLTFYSISKIRNNINTVFSWLNQAAEEQIRLMAIEAEQARLNRINN